LTDADILKYNEYAEIDHCEDCGDPIVWSCCNDEVDIDDGFCPSCLEHVL
jgi:hypothetical protein